MKKVFVFLCLFSSYCLFAPSFSLAAAPQLDKAKSVNLCGTVVKKDNTISIGFAEFTPAQYPIDGKAAFDDLLVSYQQSQKVWNKCKKKTVKDLKKKKKGKGKVSTSAINKAVKKKCGPTFADDIDTIKIWKSLQSEQCTSDSNIDVQIGISSDSVNKVYPGQHCYHNYFKFNCHFSGKISPKIGIEGNWSCQKQIEITHGYAPTDNLALVEAAGRAAEAIFEIGDQGMAMAAAKLNATIIAAAPVLLAGGSYPFELDWNFAISPRAEEQNLFAGGNFEAIFNNLLLLLNEDWLGRVIPLAIKIAQIKAFLFQSYGSTEVNNIQSLHAWESAIPEVINFSSTEWVDPSFAWSELIIKHCKLVS